MYCQGNYGSQFGHSLQAPLPPFQEGPPAPPPSFQQGPPAPPPHLVQSAPPPPTYLPPPPIQHVEPPWPPLLQQGPPIQIPPTGLANDSYSYLNLPLPVHGSSRMMASSYSTVEQNSQYLSFRTTQNVYHIPPPAPPLPAPPLTRQSHTETMRAPAPPRVLPPPPSQGKMFYRVPPHPPLPGSAQGLQHVRPTPPPPLFGSLPVASAPFTSFLHAPVEVAHPPSISPPPPPPIPSSPLLLPPSPPLPASPPPLDLSARSSGNLSDMLLDAASNMLPQSESCFHPVKLSDSAERIIDSIDKVVGPTLTMVDVPEHDDQLDGEDESICQMGSVIEDTFSYKTQTLLDLSPPLHKPEERIIRKIEVLCQFIAKNGPDFEHMAREKESRNPEFAFLFGGESGSGAAIGHEYFQWMKRKCQSEAKICNESVQSDTSLGSCQKMESSTSPNKLIDENPTFSPADSDMDMEDDGNQSSSNQGIDLSIETLNMEPVSMCDEILDVKEQLHAPQCLTECPTSSDTLSGSVSCFGNSELAKQEKEHDNSISTKDHGPVMNAPGAAELMLDSSVNKSMGPLLEDLSPFGASSAAACVSQKGLPGLLVKGESPFRLVQDYDSDDNAEDNDESQLEDVSPVRISHSVSVSNKGLHGDMVIDLDANPSSKNVSSTEKEVASFIESVALCPTSMPDVSLEPHEMVEATVVASHQLNAIAKTDELGIRNFGNQTSDNQVTSLDPFRPKDALQGDRVDTDPQNGNFQEETKQASISLEVDKFGRLIREGASDSDSDGPRFTVRHRKRGRSWSQSRSRQDKRSRHSPSRRKEKRSRSRSWSPKRNRGRSRSPLAFKRMGEKTRLDRGRIPDCFDFLRGRCYRGASCRYLHHDSATEFEPRHYRSEQPQNVEGRSDLRNPIVRGEIKNIPREMSDGEHDEVESLEIQPFQDSSVSSTDAAKDGCLVEKTEMPSVNDDVHPFISNEVGRSPVTVIGEVGQSESSDGTTVQLQEKMEVQQVPEEPTICLLENENFQLRVKTSQPLPVDCASTQPPTNAEIQNFSGETPLDEPLSGEFSDIQPPQAGDLVPLALPMLETTSHHPQKIDSSSISHSLSIQTSSSFPNMLPMSEPIPNKIPSSQAYPNSTSMSQPYPSESCAPQTMAPKEFHSSSFSPEDLQFHHSQLPPPPPLLKNINALLESQPPKDYNFAPVTATFQSQYAPVEGLPPCEAPLHASHSHFPAPPKPSWNSFPPPSSYVMELVPSSAMHTPGFPPLQFQPSPMPPSNDFSQPLGRPCPPEAPTHSQVIGFHHRTFPPREEAHRPPFHVDNPRDQQFGNPSFIREERSAMPESNQFRSEPRQDYHLYPWPQIGEHRLPLPIQDGVRNFSSLQNQRFTSQFAVQDFTSSSLFTQENMHSQPIPFPRESPATQSQMKFPGDNLPPRTFSREDFVASARNLSYSQQQDVSFGLQHSATDSLSSHMGALSKADSSISRYPPSFLDSNQSFRLPDVGGSIVANSTHYNPFASTFEQSSRSSKFNSSAFKREIDANYTSKKYDFPFGLSHASVEGQGISGIGSRQTASPSDSNKSGGHRLPRSSGSLQTQSQFVREATADDQYDPLFDSIESSSNAFRKFDTIENQETTTDVINRSVVARANDSEIKLRHSGSHRPLDLEVHNKQKIGGITVVTDSPENDEFGETLIDIELGAVKNGSPQPVDGISWSPVNLVDQANAIIGEMESDQVQTQGKGKKSKDSRSMKLFKIALADFVKEVLKPSWRQGNMSKEAFKTIVKKTVDKVSGAMKGHQIPKTQAKINQYVESSQRKLTKLVMATVNRSKGNRTEISKADLIRKSSYCRVLGRLKTHCVMNTLEEMDPPTLLARISSQSNGSCLSSEQIAGRHMDLIGVSAYGNVYRGQDSGGCSIQ